MLPDERASPAGAGPSQPATPQAPRGTQGPQVPHCPQCGMVLARLAAAGYQLLCLHCDLNLAAGTVTRKALDGYDEIEPLAKAAKVVGMTGT